MAKKVAYVTGGMGGIGTAICQRLNSSYRSRNSLLPVNRDLP